MNRWLWRLAWGITASAVLLTGLLVSSRPPGPAWAQTGFWQRATCTQITTPAGGQSFCFEQASNTLKAWNGATWTQINASATRVNNIRDYGATGDGTTNDAPAVQAAHDALPTSGGTLYFPRGIYQFSTVRLNFNRPIALVCDGWASVLTWNVTGLTNPGGNDLGVLNIRSAASGAALDWVKIHNCAFEFGGTRNAEYAEGRRGLNIYRANNIDIRGNRFNGGVGEMVGLGNMDTPIGTRAWITNNVFTDFAQGGLNPNVFDVTVTGNTFLSGVTAVEAGRSGFLFAGNTLRDMSSTCVNLASVASATVTNNRFDTCAWFPGAGVLGAINVAANGANEPTASATLANNVVTFASATHANLAGITLDRGTATSDNAAITIVGNTLSGVRQCISVVSLLDGLIESNVCVGSSASGAGIILASGGQVQRTAVSGNNIRQFAARTVNPTTNGPIQDASAPGSDNNTVSWNIQEGALVLGPTGRVDFADGATTPSVQRPAGIYYVANSAPTTITQLSNATIGQVVILVFDDANTSITDGGNFALAGNFTSSANDVLMLVTRDGTNWHEISRSAN